MNSIGITDLPDGYMVYGMNLHYVS